MKSASCKAKGRMFQGTVCDIVRAMFGLSEHDARPAIMGESGADIKLSGLGRRLFPFAVECKKQESLNVWEAMKQAEANAKKERLHPCLVFSRNRSPAYAVVPLALFVEMAKAYAREEGAE